MCRRKKRKSKKEKLERKREAKPKKKAISGIKGTRIYFLMKETADHADVGISQVKNILEAHENWEERTEDHTGLAILSASCGVHTLQVNSKIIHAPKKLLPKKKTDQDKL